MLLKWSVRPQVKAFSKRLSLELGTHYPCSRAVFTGSVYKGHEKAKRRAFFRISSKNSSFRTVAPALFALLLPPLS